MDILTYGLLNKKVEEAKNVSNEKITQAVNTYLDENPVAPGATSEQAEQIQDNTNKITELKGDLVGKLDKPETAPAIGKILKVTEVNEDGTFTCEWADGGGAVEDVQINGASIVGDGVATIPILKRGKFGLPFIEAIDSSRESNGIDVDDHFGNIKVIPSPT